MITASDNSRLKSLRHLVKSSSYREETGLFTAEGTKLFLDAPIHFIKEVYISASYENSLQLEAVKERLGQVPWESVRDDIFNKISDTKTPQGIICVLNKPQYNIEDIMKGNPFLLILERIQDPGNLGTMVRSAEAAGATGVVFTKDCADICGPKAVRASAGSVLRMPYLYADDIISVCRDLKKDGISLYAAHLFATKSHTECNFERPTGLMIGNEGQGLSEELTRLADEYLRIPMEGKIESLNAAIAATVLMYEVHRQRKGGTIQE